MYSYVLKQKLLHCTHTVESCIVQGDQKASVHLTINPHKIDDLKVAITDYIWDVDRAILNTVFENTVRGVNKYLETGGKHFEHYL